MPSLNDCLVVDHVRVIVVAADVHVAGGLDYAEFPGILLEVGAEFDVAEIVAVVELAADY